jgi:hypothetical protein
MLKPSNYLIEQAVKAAEVAAENELSEMEIEGAGGFFLKKNLEKEGRFLPVGKVSDKKGNSYYVGHYV